MRISPLALPLGVYLAVLLTACGSGGSGAASQRQAGPAAETAPTDPRVGLQLYSLRDAMAQDLGAALDSVQSWGFRYVEDGNDGTYGLPFGEYHALLREHGLEMVSVSATYAELRDSVQQVVARARAYGARYAVCFWIPHADTVLTPIEAEAAGEVFNAAGAVLAEAGITLAYHPHGYEFGAHPAGGTVLDALIRDARDYRFEMDVYWIAVPGQDPLAWLRRYPDAWVLMHLKDCGRGAGRIPTLPHANDVDWNVTLGTGQLPIAAVIAEARRLKIPYLFVEDESARVLEQAGPSGRYVRAQLAEAGE